MTKPVLTHKTPVITRSNEIYERAKKVVPAGSQTFSKGVTQFVEGFAPKYLHRGKGSRVWDVDGNDYLDYIMACHPIILGYADPDVNQAVIEQLELGSTFSLMNELEVDVTEQLQRVRGIVSPPPFPPPSSPPLLFLLARRHVEQGAARGAHRGRARAVQPAAAGEHQDAARAGGRVWRRVRKQVHGGDDV